LLVRLCECRGRLGDLAGAQRDLTAGLHLAREAGDGRLAVYALCMLSQLAYAAGKPGEMQPPAEEALALARAAGDQESEALALLRLGVAVGRPGGDSALARQCLEDSLALHRCLGNTVQVIRCLNNLGEHHRWQGDLDAAAGCYQEAIALSRQSGYRTGLCVPSFNLGEVMTARNDPAAAMRCYQEGLAVSEEIGYRANIPFCLGGLGHSALAMGDLEAARGYLLRALSEAVETRSLSRGLYVLVGFARMKAMCGDRVRAAEWVGLTLSRPSRDLDEQQRAEALLAELRQTLPADELEAALERGKSLDLQAVVDELMAEGSDAFVVPPSGGSSALHDGTS